MLLCSEVSGGERRRKDSGSTVAIKTSLFRGKVSATWSWPFNFIHCRGLRMRKVSSPFPNFYFCCFTKRKLFIRNFAEYCNVTFIISLHITFYARSAQYRGHGKHVPATDRYVVRKGFWNEETSFNPFPGTSETEQGSRFQNSWAVYL